MISLTQARILLTHLQPLILNEGLNQPITPNHFCVTDEKLQQLGIKVTALDDHAATFYDGTEWDAQARYVHVFEKDKLEAYAYGTWSDRQVADRKARESVERGG